MRPIISFIQLAVPMRLVGKYAVRAASVDAARIFAED